MKKRLAAFAGTVRRFVRSVLAPKTQSLFQPESPGVRVEITRTRFGRWFKPADFATLDEMIKYHRANTNTPRPAVPGNNKKKQKE